LTNLEIVRFVGEQLWTHVVRCANHCGSHVSWTVQHSIAQYQLLHYTLSLKHCHYSYNNRNDKCFENT